MAIAQVNTPLAQYTNDVAGFRLWGKAITDTMDALDNITQVYSDIDWATITLSASATTFTGKRVYRLDDSLTGTRDLFVALEFGRGASTGSACSFALRVTTGNSHASGTVSTNVNTHYLTTAGASTDSGEIIGVRTDFGFHLFSNITTGQNTMGVLVERFQYGGVISGDGASIVMHGSSTDNSNSTAQNIGIVQNVNYKTGAAYNNAQGNQGSLQSFHTSGVDPTFEGFAPVYPVVTIGKYDPIYGVIACYQGAGASLLFNAAVNGETGTFRTMNAGNGFDGSNNRLRYSYRVPSS